MKYLSNILLCLVVFSGPAIDAAADPGEIVPYVSVKQEYSDNILFTSNNEEEDYITTCKAGARFSYRTERINGFFDGNIYRLLYWDNDQLDSTDGEASASINHQVTEKLSLGSSAAYRNTSRRDADTDTTGLIVSGDREKTDLLVNIGYIFNEISSGQAELRYGIQEIDEINNEEENDTFGITLGFSRNLSENFPNTIGLLNFQYFNYSSDQENRGVNAVYQEYDSDVFQLYGGFSKDITELYNVYCQVGVSYTDTTESIRINSFLFPDQDSSTWGGVLLSGLNYDGLYWDAGVSVSHDIRGSSGTNGTVERSAVSLDIERKINEGFFFTFGASCYLNKNERKTRADLDDLTINIQPGFRYRFFDTFILSGVFRHTTVEDRNDDTTKERNLVYLAIKKNFELK